MRAYLNDYIGGVDDFVELSPDAPRLSLLEQPVSGHISHPMVQRLLSLLSLLIPDGPNLQGLGFRTQMSNMTSRASTQAILENLEAVVSNAVASFCM